MSRREALGWTVRAGAAGLFLGVPQLLYRSPWAERAAAQGLPGVQANFTALVEAVTTVADAAAGAWIVGQFDRALPPLPSASPSAAASAVLDAFTLRAGQGPSFAGASPEGRRAVLRDMVKDPLPDVRQLANQLIPFAAFAHWSDATLSAPARPGGPRPPQWGRIGFPGPAHDHLATYRRDGPPGFRPADDFEP